MKRTRTPKKLGWADIISISLIVLFAIAHLTSIILARTVDWRLIVSSYGIVLLFVAFWHFEEILDYMFKERRGFIILRNIMRILPFLAFIIPFLNAYGIAKLYFDKTDFSVWYNLVPAILLILGMIISLLYVLSQIIPYFYQKKLELSELALLISSFLHIINLFTSIYIVLYCINSHAFTGIVITNQFDLYIDFLYFSTVTFTSLGFGDIHACTSIAKIFVIIESLLFTIGVSIILVFFLGKLVPREKEPRPISPALDESTDAKEPEASK